MLIHFFKKKSMFNSVLQTLDVSIFFHIVGDTVI